MRCIEINHSIINLDLVKRVDLIKSQFGGYILRIDDTDFDTPKAQQMYKQIKEIMLEKYKNPYDISKLLGKQR